MLKFSNQKQMVIPDQARRQSLCVCVYLRCFNNHSYTFRLQSLCYTSGDLLGQTLLNWKKTKHDIRKPD